MNYKFKPIYIPIALTGFLVIVAFLTGCSTVFELIRSSFPAYSGVSGQVVFFLLVLPLSLLLLFFAGMVYLGIIIGIWAFYGICFFLVRFIKKHFLAKDYEEDPSAENNIFADNPSKISAENSENFKES